MRHRHAGHALGWLQRLGATTTGCSATGPTMCEVIRHGRCQRHLPFKVLGNHLSLDHSRSGRVATPRPYYWVAEEGSDWIAGQAIICQDGGVRDP